MPTATPAPPGPGRRAFEVVLHWVESRILAGDLSVGDVLPAERELAQTLEVSRAAVREAVRALQAMGVVRSAVGAGGAGGTTITAVPSRALTDLLQLHVALTNFPLADVIEVRVALERLSVRLVAGLDPDEHLSDVRAALDAMAEPTLDRQGFNDADTAFHVALATAGGNRLAADLTTAIRESLRLPILDRFRSLEEWDEVVRRLRSDHEAIYAAVARHDAEEAERLMEQHIRSAWSSLDG